MSTKAEATVADLAQYPGEAELVHGELVVMSPIGGLPGYAAGEIVSSLRDFAKTQKSAFAIGDNVGFIVDLPHRRSFCPDAAYYIGSLSMDFVAGSPLFAVEVRSKGDYGTQAEKRRLFRRRNSGRLGRRSTEC